MAKRATTAVAANALITCRDRILITRQVHRLIGHTVPHLALFSLSMLNHKIYPHSGMDAISIAPFAHNNTGIRKSPMIKCATFYH
jgi:hypothetical protein